jgi:hypothetical protein
MLTPYKIAQNEKPNGARLAGSSDECELAARASTRIFALLNATKLD